MKTIVLLFFVCDIFPTNIQSISTSKKLLILEAFLMMTKKKLEKKSALWRQERLQKFKVELPGNEFLGEHWFGAARRKWLHFAETTLSSGLHSCFCSSLVRRFEIGTNLVRILAVRKLFVYVFSHYSWIWLPAVLLISAVHWKSHNPCKNRLLPANISPILEPCPRISKALSVELVDMQTRGYQATK